jgi:hypothetical protein
VRQFAQLVQIGEAGLEVLQGYGILGIGVLEPGALVVCLGERLLRAGELYG